MSVMAIGAQNGTKPQPHPRPTAGERFPDGSFLELVRDPGGSACPQLLRYQKGQTTIALEQEYDGCRYVACESATEIRHLPSKLARYGSTRILFDRVREFIAKATAAQEDFCRLLTYFVFTSFFCDCLSLTPCLLLWTPAVLDGIAVLRTLSCVCFHPVLLANGTLTSVPPELRPITRLLCQHDSNLDIMLAGLQFPGFLGKGLRQISGATAVLVGDAEFESPFAETCLFISVPPLTNTFSLEQERAEAESIEQLQNCMLAYRLQNFSQVQHADFDPLDLKGTSRELARIFGKCIVEDSDLQYQIVDLLRSRNDADEVQATTKLEAIIVEALIVVCHRRKTSVHVHEVADLANGILSRQGEYLEMRPREVGGKLKILGFSTTRLDSAGRGVLLLKDTCARIHDLARAFGVPTIREPLPGCPYCNQS